VIPGGAGGLNDYPRRVSVDRAADDRLVDARRGDEIGEPRVYRSGRAQERAARNPSTCGWTDGGRGAMRGTGGPSRPGLPVTSPITICCNEVNRWRASSSVGATITLRRAHRVRARELR
jgi:hypothetical protein